MPIFGAVFQWKLWTDAFGSIAEINLVGQRAIIVSSEKAAHDLLVSNGKILSGRPSTVAVKDAQSKYGTSEYLPLMSFNEDHHRQKAIGRLVMTRSQANDNLGYPTSEARRLICRLSQTCNEPSDRWIRLTEEYTSRVMSRLCFGSPEYADKLHGLTWELLTWVSPNGVLPNLINKLDVVPFYLSPWKIMEWYRHRKQQGWFSKLLEDTRSDIRNGRAVPSFLRDHVINFDSYPSEAKTGRTYESDSDASKAIGMMATAGIFTISGPLQNVVRALVCFPEWQKLLQEEADRNIEFPILPEISDIKRLPLLRAFIREVVRWRQAIPSGIPHEAEETLVYKGVVIEKGDVIFAHEYGMSRDPTVYENPYEFNPYRWLTSPEAAEKGMYLTGTPMFGWGRRYCMGHELAQDEIYAFAAHVIWAFNISTPDQDLLQRNLLPNEKIGGHQWPQKRAESLIIMRPGKIRVQFSPRSAAHLQRIRESLPTDTEHW